MTAREITTDEELTALVGEPLPRVRDKARPALTDLDRQWLAATPFVVVATSADDGSCDASPKGDPAGDLVHVLDERTVALAERPGNKRVDGYTFQGVTTRPFLSLGIPFDDLTDTQQQAINNRGGPGVATVNVNQQVNADAALNIRGWEAIWVQPLRFVFDGLGFMANYTKIDISTVGRDAGALAGNVYGVSPSMWNATTYWENSVASVRLSYTWQEGAVGTGPNQQGIPQAQIFGDDRGQLDLAASYTLSNVRSQPQITFNILNITGEERRSNFWYPNAVNDLYDPGRTYSIGIRGTF